MDWIPTSTGLDPTFDMRRNIEISVPLLVSPHFVLTLFAGSDLTKSVLGENRRCNPYRYF
ncbi:MAG: hypothetical protein OHK0056_26300 [Bacteriovoracaceae bacterium]